MSVFSRCAQTSGHSGQGFLPLATQAHTPPCERPRLLKHFNEEARARFGQGKVTHCIPAVGDARVAFSLQSITRLFTFVLALCAQSDDLWKRVGHEPLGAACNFMVLLETANGIPRNPFINAGALVITESLTSHRVRLDCALLDTLRRPADDHERHWSPDVAQNEREHADREMAMAQGHENFHNDPALVLDAFALERPERPEGLTGWGCRNF